MKTADLSDQYTHLQYCNPVFRSYGKLSAFHGVIRTVRCYEDNSMVRQLLSTPGNGAVLIIDAGASTRCAVVGDQLASLAITNKWAGIIVNGFIRDSADINQMDIGVKALGTFPLKSQKEGTGEIDLGVHFAGVFFDPGQYVYADEDGVIVSKKPL